MNHLTDQELVNHVIKFSDDPEKIRLATVMERVSGAIIDDLVEAGMDDLYCTFHSQWGGHYHPGKYITLLENQIRDRDFKIQQLNRELAEQRARTIADLISELRQDIQTADYNVKQANDDRMKAVKERDLAKDKLSMWTKLNGQV